MGATPPIGIPVCRRTKSADARATWGTPSRPATCTSSTRCPPLVSTSSGAPSTSKSRLLAIAPTGMPSCAAAWAAVRALPVSSRTWPAAPEAASRSATAATRGCVGRVMPRILPSARRPARPDPCRLDQTSLCRKPYAVHDDEDRPVDDPAATLAELASLRSRTRRDGRGWGFPLTLLGALVLLATPLYWYVPPPEGASLTDSFAFPLVRALGGVFTAHPLAIAVYWLVALLVGFLGSGLWYRRHARRVGLRRPVLGFVLTGLAVTVGLLVLQEIPFLDVLLFYVSGRGTSSIAVIAVSLFVLARLERSRVLLLFAVGFLGITVLVGTYNVENLVMAAGVPFGGWATATPVLLPGLVLLVGGLAA